MIGIYKITNKINGKCYVGQSKNIQQRKIDHFKSSTLNRKRNKNIPLYQDILKYGQDKFTFEVITLCKVEDLNRLETYYINQVPKEKRYNIALNAIPMHDKTFSKKRGRFFHQWNKKQWENKDYREERSKASNELQKKRLQNPNYLAEKTKQLKKYTDSLKKKVAQYDKKGNLIAIYDGVREAERATGVSSQAISKVALHKPHRKTANGFKWEYL